jgi:SagB-type dehydrogenase family enzyme
MGSDASEDRHPRGLLRSNWESLREYRSDEARGRPAPPIQKPAGDRPVRRLPGVKPDQHREMTLAEAVFRRRSIRAFADEPVSLRDLSFLLWATQGVRRVLGDGRASLRTVPSGGARHALDTYLFCFRVSDLAPGVYRYLPLDHAVCLEGSLPPAGRLASAAVGQTFLEQAAVTFAWVACPYRMEWRYGPVSQKIIALDAGHVCQNLYLACCEIGAGTCAIGAYCQDACDQLLGLDGEEEMVVYMAPVGRPSASCQSSR